MLQDSRPKDEFWEWLEANELRPCFTKPTRLTDKGGSLIDNIMTSIEDPFTASIAITDISDHLTLVLKVHKTHNHSKNLPETITFRKMKEENINHLLGSQNWMALAAEMEQEKKFEIFEQTFSQIFDFTCPKTTRRRNKNVDKEKEWMTRGLLVSRKKKDKLLSASHNSTDQEKTRLCKKYCRIYYSTVRAAREKHKSEFYKSHKSDMKKLWQHTNEILHRKTKSHELPTEFRGQGGEKLSSSAKIAEGFNAYFANVGKELAKNFPGDTTEKYVKNIAVSTTLFKFRKTNAGEIAHIINKMHSKISSSFDDVSNVLLKKIKFEIAEPLPLLINNSLETGTMPKKLKVAKVIPLFKSGDRKDYGNYRPISLLSVFSKIYEKIVYKSTQCIQ